MPTDRLTKTAVAIGHAEAQRILEFRRKALRKRVHATRQLKRQVIVKRAELVPESLVRAVGGEASAGVLVAEGDSWFDYPLNDVLRLLEDEHAYDIESVAHKGDSVEAMAYGGGQLEEFARRLEKLLRQNVIPKAILLSGGGNDIAGDQFGMLLNHARSAVAGFNEQVLAGVVNERIRMAYITVLTAVTDICEQRVNKRLPIVVHGYDYPVPDGRGFIGGWGSLPGPWLEPGFREKGFEPLQERIGLFKKVIDRFNAMLKELTHLRDLSHVTHIDIRGTLTTDAAYKKWWANELHPTPRGFQLVTDKFAAAIARL